MLKISLVILRGGGGEIDMGGMPASPKYTPVNDMKGLTSRKQKASFKVYSDRINNGWLYHFKLSLDFNIFIVQMVFL